MKNKKQAVVKFEEKKICHRRDFLADLINIGKVCAIGSIASPAPFLLTSGCGGLSSDTVPGGGEGSLSLQINGSRGTDENGNPVVRANGEDILECVATVKGLSSSVGFFLAKNWGSFQGGTLGDNGYTYFTADKDGKARAIFVASSTAGRAELMVKSKDKTVSQALTFDFATLTIFPSAITFDGENSTEATVVARGGEPPIEWSVSHPRALWITKLNDTTIRLSVMDWAALQATGTIGATLYAIDAEGQIATAVVKPGMATCTTADLSVDPSIGTAGQSLTVSITLDDFDRAGESSVSVVITGEGMNATTTLTPWITPGVFQNTYTFTPTASGTLTFSTPDTDAACQSAVAMDTMTIT